MIGHIATTVEGLWAPSHPFRRQQRVWMLVTWADGHRDQITEDYSPWISVKELKQGHLTWFTSEGEVTLSARWLDGAEAIEAWERYGIHNDVSFYMGRQSEG